MASYGEDRGVTSSSQSYTGAPSPDLHSFKHTVALLFLRDPLKPRLAVNEFFIHFNADIFPAAPPGGH